MLEPLSGDLDCESDQLGHSNDRLIWNLPWLLPAICSLRIEKNHVHKAMLPSDSLLHFFLDD